MLRTIQNKQRLDKWPPCFAGALAAIIGRSGGDDNDSDACDGLFQSGKVELRLVEAVFVGKLFERNLVDLRPDCDALTSGELRFPYQAELEQSVSCHFKQASEMPSIK